VSRDTFCYITLTSKTDVIALVNTFKLLNATSSFFLSNSSHSLSPLSPLSHLSLLYINIDIRHIGPIYMYMYIYILGAARRKIRGWVKISARVRVWCQWRNSLSFK